MNIPAIIFWILTVILITGAATFSVWWLVLFFILGFFAAI